MKNKNVNFIFGLLDKKKVVIAILLEAILDFIYYVVPFTFTFLLTMPFTIKKALIVVSVFIISKVIRVIGNYLLDRFVGNYLYEYQNIQYEEYFHKLIKLPSATIEKYGTGYFMNIIEKIVSLTSDLLQTEYLGIILSFVFLFYTAYNQSAYIFLIALICSIICVLISLKIYKKSNNVVEKLYDEEYEYNLIYQDYIGNIKTVKTLNCNDYFEGKIKKKGKTKYEKNHKYVKVYSAEGAIRNTCIVIPFIVGLIKAVIDLQNGIDTLGIIAFYISLHVEMGYIFEELSKTLINRFKIRSIKKKLNNIFEVLDTRELLEDFNIINLDDISIHYDEAKFNIEISSLHIKKNDKICITGKSGEGKTSILNVILGINSNYCGDVYIDNYNLKDKKLDIGVISQEVELFNMSIKDNLCLNKKINDELLIKYLKELNLDDLLNFKDGLNTIVGEKGLKLSTGQKRRLNILRSLLMNKEVYILDEPTSNLDKETEKIVVNFILKYFSNKTLIIATHNSKIKEICNEFYEVKNHALIKCSYSKKAS